ncbi:MAG: aspartate aminotransferase family protein, partial [Acidobacteriota bacterium]|nr:aspartate aminotransferase family protein [Acidobacteriota bacterium]
SDYLDRGDELDGVVNLVGRSLDTSRRFDALKVVTSLRTLGRRNLAAMLEQLVALTNYAAARVEESPHLALVAAPATVSCVFDAPGFDADALRDVQQRLLLRGEMVLGRTKIKGRAALKFTFMNPLTTTDDVDQLIALITDELAASGASRRS